MEPRRQPRRGRYLATLGASEVPLVGRDPAHRVEFFVGLLPAKDEVAKPVAMLASYSAREKKTLDHGHAVTFPEPLWTGTGSRSFLVMRPLSDVLSTLQLGERVHVEFLQAIPLFPSEVAFKEAKDAEALMSRWESSRVPFWDPARSPEPVTAVAGPELRRLGQSVLYLPVAGVDEVAAAVGSATAGLGVAGEERPFRGHLTIARAARGVDPRPPVPVPFLASWAVDEVTLVASTLHPDGARYQVIGRYPLAGSS